MKKYIRILLISALYLINKINPFKTCHKGKTRILVYHHVDKCDKYNSVLRRISDKYNIISFKDYVEGKVLSERINVIISLDDGYESWFSCASKVFNELDIQPILSVNSDFIGLSSKYAEKYCKENIWTWPEKAMNWEQLLEMRAKGAYVCSHALTHVDLTCSSISRVDKMRLIEMDRDFLQNRLGCIVDGFTYPYGRYDKCAIDLVESIGFSYAFTSDSGFLDKSQFPFEIKRTNVGMRGYITTCALIEGWGDFLTKISCFIRKKIKI